MSTAANDQLTANKTVVRRIYEEGYDQGDPKVFETLYAPGFEHHSKVIHDVAPGGAGEAQSMRRFHEAIPDVRFEVGTQIAEGDFVATRLHISGHPVGDYGPVRSSDDVFDVEALVLFRVEDGRVAEEWLYVDGGQGPAES
ncbi:MAG TPA: ester cyclase [Acidimicrobiales bacterium]|jgi:predicted ester cyclase